MKIILTNKTELSIIGVNGASSYTQGANRDTLSFIFPGTEDMNVLDSTFTPETCESIIIVGDDGSEHRHNGYTIRAKMEKFRIEIAPATSESEAVTEERITVSMSQRTYTETQLAALTVLLEGEV